MEAHTGSCGVALSSYVGQKRATDNIDVHKFNFTFKKGHYVNDLDINDLHSVETRILQIQTASFLRWRSGFFRPLLHK